MRKNLRLNSLFIVGAMVLVITIAMTFWMSCNKTQDIAGAPTVNQQETITFTKENPQVQAVMAVQDKHTPDIMVNPNVVGTATGLTEDGKLAILVFLKEEVKTPIKGRGIAAAGIPKSIEGIPVITEVTGEIKALKTTVSHTAKQTPPIQLGTSGGWRYDLANGYCCGGTLGSLIQKGGTQYILSNYHVLEADIVSGGNNRVAQAGDPVIQPGLIDVSCNASLAQNVATLSGLKTLPYSNIDAAIAPVISGMVRTDGAILEVGTISAQTVAAYIGQPVKKSGRTSGLTRTTVYALNATINVSYENECAGSITSWSPKQFTGQIVFKGGKFIQSGDSGSLAVEDVTTNPRAVALCFAGSSLYGFGNPINEVLSHFGATMVGQ